MSAGTVVAVSCKAEHGVDKPNRAAIRLIAGLGVEGDAHLGEKVQHRSRARRDPDSPNLRQVHLLHAELHAELARSGLEIAPGQMGENVTTRGVDLLGLPAGTKLRLGNEAVVEVTGLRNPCRQLDAFAPGLLAATVARADDGSLVRKAGIMCVVRVGGEVRPGDSILLELPKGAQRPPEPV